MNVGLTIQAALDRGSQHQRACSRHLAVYIRPTRHGERDGLAIVACIAARSPEELAKQFVSEIIPWEDLDARAGELVGIVDRLVAEVETRFGLRTVAA